MLKTEMITTLKKQTTVVVVVVFDARRVFEPVRLDIRLVSLTRQEEQDSHECNGMERVL